LCPVGHYCPSGTKSSTAFRCPAGRYGDVEGAKNSACSGPCTAGYHCDEGSSSPKQYQCGVVGYIENSHTGNPADFNVTYGFANRSDGSAYMRSFNTSTSLLLNTADVKVSIINSNNYYCPEGSALPITVLPGFYSTGGNATTRTGQSMCTVGTYCLEGVLSQCPAGTYSNKALATSPLCGGLCAKGHYCPAGSSSSTQFRCPIGTYGSELGLGSPSCSGSCVTPLDCPEGTIAKPVAA
jgi:hypothetical protein